jgi:hypothetical protein
VREHRLLRRDHLVERALDEQHAHLVRRRQVSQQRRDHLHGATARAVEPSRVAREPFHRRVFAVAARIVGVCWPRLVDEERQSAGAEHLHDERRARAWQPGDDRHEAPRRAHARTLSRDGAPAAASASQRRASSKRTGTSSRP